MDLHTHPMSNLAFGGKLLYGGVDAIPSGGSLLPADPDCNEYVRARTMEQALGHDKSTHGGHNFFSNPCGDDIRRDVIHRLQQGLSARDETDDASGAPYFLEWPAWDDVTHQKMWVDWIKRTYDAGLRVMVALAHNNKTLGDATAGPGDRSTDDKYSGDLQIWEMKWFVSRHSDFMEIAYSSTDLQRIVSANKLAVVLGVELDNIGNLETKAPVPVITPPILPTKDQISSEIERLYGDGVRYIFPIHLVDNAFGGAAAYVDLFNLANYFQTGQFWNLECANSGDGISYTYGEPPRIGPAQQTGIDAGAILEMLVKLGSVASVSYPSCQGVGQRNSLGLRPEGEFALKEMMRHGMLIDVDHMSLRSAIRAFEIAGAVPNGGYPLNSGHNAVRGSLNTPDNNSERALTRGEYATIGNLHGMAGVGSAGIDAYAWVQAYSTVLNAMGKGAVAGFGTDTNGLVLGMPPTSPQSATVRTSQYEACMIEREQDCKTSSPSHLAACRAAAKADCQQQYPSFVTKCVMNCGHPLIQYSPSFPKSTLGGRSWDYNTDGVAHYGMIADFLQDVKNVPAHTPDGLSGAQVIDNLMLGADYFYNTWKMCEAQKANVN